MGVVPFTSERKMTTSLIGLVAAIATLATIDLHLTGGLIAGTQSLDTARTAGFTVLVLAQLFDALNSRSESVSAFHLALRRRARPGSGGRRASPRDRESRGRALDGDGTRS